MSGEKSKKGEAATKPRRVTIRDIAEEGKVAFTTAQKVLSGGTVEVDSVRNVIEAHRRLLVHRPNGTLEDVLSDAWIWRAVVRPNDPDDLAHEAVHNLPPHSAPLHGREDDLVNLGKFVKQSPLVTLLGGPGFGRSSLAHEYARSVVRGPWDRIHAVNLAGAANESDAADC
ncbi:hypothetical protein EON81_21670 [bacterium]|nr:MAG: hypothetical protein EON81_21670 [bacterium]